MTFKELIRQGIPSVLPPPLAYNTSISHAPKRKKNLTNKEKKLAVRNALRYFPLSFHNELAIEFVEELNTYGRIYMYRFRPSYAMYARHIDEYPYVSLHAGAIMAMIQNNLNPIVAQHPHELITYGGNGSVFQNWAQYLLTMCYLSNCTNEQTLHIYSGHPMGLFPSNKNSPRVVITNGMMIPNYSKQDDLEKYNALGVTQYGQMTAGSYMYIGPQGIVHGTSITLLNAGRIKTKKEEKTEGKLFLSAGLGGMSGAQPKAASIAGYISVIAEINPKAIQVRYSQGWVDEVIDDLNTLTTRVSEAKKNKEIVSIAYKGNIVEVWEKFNEDCINIDIGSDQTSLHNPWAGGYYPVGYSYEESNNMMVNNPKKFKKEVEATLIRHVDAINKHTQRGTYFFDYGNAFLLEASRAGANIMAKNGVDFKYNSYVQDTMGPLYFDYGFGPFRWVCISGHEEDLALTDTIATAVLTAISKKSPTETQQQLADNIKWIKSAKDNNLVVGSQARILYADSQGRIEIALAFNKAIAEGKITAPIVLGRDHHDVSGTDSPFRETANIYDGSQFTADMAIHNVIGDSFRGASWVSIHNGGGVGWGEVINGGFGLVLDGTKDADTKLRSMLSYDVNNGIARRSWAGNKAAKFTINKAMQENDKLKITVAHNADSTLLDTLF